MSVLKIVTGRRNALLTIGCVLLLYIFLQFLNEHAVIISSASDHNSSSIFDVSFYVRSIYENIQKLKLNLMEQQHNFNSSKDLNDTVLSNVTSRIKQYGEFTTRNCTGYYKKNVTQHPLGEKCEKRLPKAIVVGIQKSGTMALLYFLSRHPEMSVVLQPTELNYFTKHSDEPLEFYRKMMNCSFSNQISIEKSPMYFYCKKCPSLIKEMDKDIKIVIIIKEPIDRALSQHAMIARLSRSTNITFSQVVIDENGNVKGSNQRINFSSYIMHISEWLQNFPLSQIHFVDGHRFESDPALELNKLEEFLEIGSYFTCDKFTFNAAKNKYCLKTEYDGADCLHDGKGNEHSKLSEEDLNTLQDYFRPLNQQFFELVHRRFEWGY